MTEAQLIKRQEFVDRFERLATALPDTISLPDILTLDDFRRLLAAMKTVHKRSALYWGLLYKEAVRRFGHEAYQLFTSFDYAESTLQNYGRLTEQLHPSLWNEPLPDRHLLAIAQTIPPERLDEQRHWVAEAKKNGASADDLRRDIHRDQQERGLRKRVVEVDWITCDECGGSCKCQRCGGEGGWPEDVEN